MCLPGPSLLLSLSLVQGYAFSNLKCHVSTLTWHPLVSPDYHCISLSLRMDFWISISWWWHKSQNIKSFLHLKLGDIYLVIKFKRIKMRWSEDFLVSLFFFHLQLPSPSDLWLSRCRCLCSYRLIPSFDAPIKTSSLKLLSYCLSSTFTAFSVYRL